jgi:hypothetical protein
MAFRILRGIALAAAIFTMASPVQAQPSGDAVFLSGDVVFEDCTPAMRDNIESAMALIVGRFDGAAMPACLRDAVITEDQGSSVEHILQRLSENQPTRVICKPEPCGGPGFNGCAGVGNGEEVLTLRSQLAQEGPVDEIAGVIVHEVLHRKNFGHPGSSLLTDYPFTVPVQTAQCVRRLQVRGLARSAAPGDTELAMFGGTGGDPFDLRCPSGGLVTGMRVGSGEDINFVALHCGPVTLGPVGEERGTIRTENRRCPAGQVGIGLRMRAGRLVNQMAMECAALDALKANQSSPATSLLFLGGEGAGPLAATRTCPTGMAMKGLRGRSGARIDRVRVICEDVDTVRQPAPHSLALVGQRNGLAKSEHCLGHGVVTTVYGHSGGSLDRLGVACAATRASRVLPDAAVVLAGSTTHALDWNGGNGGSPFTLPCPANTVVVGLEFRQRTGVDAVRAACVGINDWRPGGPAAIAFTSWKGHPRGIVRSRICPRGSFVAGLHSWSKKTVHDEPTLQGVAPICRAISYRIGLAPN